MGEPHNELATKRLFLRLDEAHTGSIPLSTFQAFVRQGNVRDTVNLYTSGEKLPISQGLLINPGFWFRPCRSSFTPLGMDRRRRIFYPQGRGRRKARHHRLSIRLYCSCESLGDDQLG